MDRLYVYCADSYIGQLIKEDESYRFVIENDSDYFSRKGIAENALDTRGGDFRFLYDIMVCDRVCPSDRLNIHEVLNLYGLREYDPWELLKATYGMNVNDLIWMHSDRVDGSWFYEFHPDGRRMAESRSRSGSGERTE